MSVHATPGRHVGSTPYDVVMDISPPHCEWCNAGMRSPKGWRAIIHMNAYGAPRPVGLLCPDCQPPDDGGSPARFTEGGKVPKPHPKSQLEWPEGKPRGGKPPTRENGEIAYRRPKP